MDPRKQRFDASQNNLAGVTLVRRRDFTRVMGKLVLTGSSLFPLAARAAEREGINWHQEMPAAWQSMRDERRPMLLFVTMDGCRHCTRMKSQTYQDERVVGRIRTSFVAAAINGPRQPDVARRLGVRVYPTTLIISPEYRVIESIRGFVSPDEMTSRLAAISERLASNRR
jgi:thioredoxin-related protein